MTEFETQDMVCMLIIYGTLASVFGGFDWLFQMCAFPDAL